MTDEDVAFCPLFVNHHLLPGLDLGLDYDCPLWRFHLSLLSSAPLGRRIPNVGQVVNFFLVDFYYYNNENLLNFWSTTSLSCLQFLALFLRLLLKNSTNIKKREKYVVVS
jgi:hypothetical protein